MEWNWEYKATILKLNEDVKAYIDTIDNEQEFQQLTLWSDALHFLMLY